ncbi:MAG: hypothetical protein V3T24_13595, partial [Longimicrobiales bacterium]
MKLLLLSTPLLLIASVAGGVDDAAPITGRQIMELVDNRDDGDKSTQDMKMILIDKNGSQRKRTIRSFRMDMGEDTYSIMF